ncbi:hypothetical protein KC19_6G171900 [Ceratodon purpureus]|uniref:Secreted protein n=1 Tax=Ceratodon purpureus TaxID=3225 RepID=A0A8T0HI02_CERPU|nr:hypothetical protein KC19_6G171900 [Ceratodon purpureus]
MKLHALCLIIHLVPSPTQSSGRADVQSLEFKTSCFVITQLDAIAASIQSQILVDRVHNHKTCLAKTILS